MQTLHPSPLPGLRKTNFKKICDNGFGDRTNAYAYSMVWFQSHLYVGTGRANLMLLKYGMPFVKIDQWPVEVPYPPYHPEFEQTYARGEIWRYSPVSGIWERVYQSTMVRGNDGIEFSRHLGYRAMVVFQGESDSAPCLYVASWSRSRGDGAEILRSEDGVHFTITPKLNFRSQNTNLNITAIRVLVPFKGKLYTAPTGASKGNVNGAWTSLIYESSDPATGQFRSVNDPGLGGKPASPENPEVVTVYEMAVMGDYLYAGTAGYRGFQIWRTKGEGKPPYHWEQVLKDGAGRLALNQGTTSMISYKGALYIGTGIQNGGYDHKYKVGPAAAEIIRINPDNSWDIVVGNPRDGKEPISGLRAGFNNYFCGYIWRMGIHDGWLYVGTMDWSVILRYSHLEEKPALISRLIAEAGIEDFVAQQGGFELWRTYDGENWLPVCRHGLGNPYNYGGRNIVSTPHGLFIGTANPFGPRVAKRVSKSWQWSYVNNPDGGLEVWQGNFSSNK